MPAWPSSALPVIFLALPAVAAFPAFLSREISPAGETFYRETLLPADIDGDGDADFFGGDGRGGKQFWFENPGSFDGAWIRRPVHDSNEADVGAALMDVDGDGLMDKVSSSLWYRNPGFTGPGGKNRPFGMCRYGGSAFLHDLYPADMDGDGHPDLLAVDYDGIRWYKVERDSACKPWTGHMINGYSDVGQHGGIAAGDIDGDGDLDVFSSGSGQSARMPTAYAWENLDGKAGTWKEHRLDSGRAAHEATMADIDGDGDADLVAKTWGGGEQYWLENRRIQAPGALRGDLRGGAIIKSRPAPGLRLYRAREDWRDAGGRLRSAPGR